MGPVEDNCIRDDVNTYVLFVFFPLPCSQTFAPPWTGVPQAEGGRRGC